MKLKKIKIRNIRSYKEQEIVFPEGSVLLSGDVGSGKSTILLAIEYALFGLQPGQKGSALLRHNKIKGEVTLELEIDGKEIIIERRLKRSPKGVSNEYASITIENEKIESSVTEIKSKIVQLLGYPPEFIKKNNLLYRYTIHSPQEQMKQIILEDSETRLTMLRHIFGVDKYRQIKSNLSLYLNNLKNSSKLLQIELKDLEEAKKNLETKKNALLDLAEKIKKQKTELAKEKKELENLENDSLSLEEKINIKRKLEGEIEKANILITTKKERLGLLKKEQVELNAFIEEIKDPSNLDDYASILNYLNSQKQELENLNSIFLEIKGKTSYLRQEEKEIDLKKEKLFKIEICPTCLQDVSPTYKHNIVNEFDIKLSNIQKEFEYLAHQSLILSEKKELIKKEIDSLEKKRITLEVRKAKIEQVQKAISKLQEITYQIESTDKDLSLLSRHITGLKEKILDLSKYEAQFLKKEKEIKEARGEEKIVEIYLAELNKEFELTNREIYLQEAVIKNKEQARLQMLETESLINWLNSNFSRLVEMIEINVLLKLRSEFSNSFRKWFQLLVPDSTFDSQIDESFSPIIMQSGVELEYDFLSGGERTAVALAYRLALNQTINTVVSKIKTKDLIILDEPTDGFSEAQINKIRDILDELNMGQVLIVSHEQKIEGFVENVMKVVKFGDSSQIFSN